VIHKMQDRGILDEQQVNLNSLAKTLACAGAVD
jgi:hypothetical protein